MRSRSLSDQVVVITGAARGIGLATARQLARNGARVAIADLDADLACARAEEIHGSMPFKVDVTDRASFEDLLESVREELGPIDVLVNNAAVLALGPFLQAKEHTIRRQIEVNLVGVINGMQLAIPEMLRRGRGHVLNISSPVGKYATPGEAVYAATKHAVVALSQIAQAELRNAPIDISLVFMGPVADTELASGMQSVRGIRMLAIEQVATAIVDTLRQPRSEVWVPRHSRWLETTQHLLPRTIREWTQRMFGLHIIATQIDWAERLPYEERAFQDRTPVA